MSATAFILDVVKSVIAELRGESVSDWTTEKVAKAIADKVAESIAATVASELRVYANALDLRTASMDLAEAANRLLMRLRDAESGGGLPKLPVEIVKEITDEDRAREKAMLEELAKP